MRVPWILLASSAAQVLPVGAAGLRRLTGPRKWIVGWSAVLLVTDALALGLALQNRNNHWVNYLGTPLAAGLALWALSHWQVSAFAARVVRLLIPVLWMIWVALVLLVEETGTFSLLAQPVLGLVIMGAVIWTLVSRTSREANLLRDQDWLWVGIGLVVYFGSAVALPPVSYLLLPKSPQLVIRALEVRGILNIVAFLVIARGILCPVPRMAPAPS